MSSPSQNSWQKHHVVVLIHAYKEETCLYAIKSPHYHNKRLRAEALRRVRAAVCCVRPETTEKECFTKFHNMRNSFNVENGKVRSSVKSGVDTENVYKPSLWYFDSLKFLEEHFVPRKSSTSQLKRPAPAVLSQFSQDDDTQDASAGSSVTTVSDGFSGDGHFHVYVEGDREADESPERATNISILPHPSSCESTSAPNPTISSSSRMSPVPPPPSSACISKKRKVVDKDAYVGAIESIANSLRQPITIPSNCVNTHTDPVDTCMAFVGSVLKTFQSEELKLVVMNTMVQTVINARTSDLESATRR